MFVDREELGLFFDESTPDWFCKVELKLFGFGAIGCVAIL